SRSRARLDQDPEHVIVACGGVVGEDQCPRVGGRDAARRKVEASADSQAGAAAAYCHAAVGPVERDDTVVEREARCAGLVGTTVEDAAALAIAAVAAVARAADGLVQGDQRVGDAEDASVLVGDAAALPDPARGARP